MYFVALRFGVLRIRALRAFKAAGLAGLFGAIALCAMPAAGQTPAAPKVDNLSGVPGDARPGVIEAIFDDQFAIPAAGQTPVPSKIDNLGGVLGAARSDAIKAAFDDQIAPGVTLTPNIYSPLELEQPANARNVEFLLNGIVLDGASSISQARIESLYSARIGEVVSLSSIYDIARSITKLYVDEGYPLSLAYLPIQEINNGVVRIRIIEGFIGSVDVSGAPPRMRGHLAKLGRKLTAERPLKQKTLERYLLLASKIPGAKVTGVIEKGEAPGAGLTLVMKVRDKRFDIAAGANNRASRAVGREKFHGRLKVNGLVTGVDDFSFLAVQSFDLDELTYFSAGWSTIVSDEGLRLGLSATRSEAAPGIPLLKSLGFQTEGWTAGVGLTYPLILNREKKLTLSSKFTWKEFRSVFGVTPNTLDTLWTSEFGAAFSFSDGLKGSNAAAVNIVKGWDIFDATKAGSPVASRAGGSGEFFAVIADLSRRQVLTDWADMFVAVQAQTANNPLLSSEQCGFGGAGFGRGYDPFEISGDRCIVGLIELRANPAFLQHDNFKVQPYISLDAGAVRQIGPLAAGQSRTQSRYSFAAGARFSIAKHLSASIEAGVPLKGIVAQEGDDDPRLFFSIEAKY